MKLFFVILVHEMVMNGDGILVPNATATLVLA